MKLLFKIIGGFVGLIVVALLVLGVVISHDSACVPAPAVAAGAETMQAIRYRCYGSPDEVLELAEVEKPVPGDDQVLVKIVAAAVNPLDWHYMRGAPYIMRLMGAGIGSPADSRLGVDFAGVVESVGSNVTNFKPGDAVFGGTQGAFAEYAISNAGGSIALKPENVSFEEAAAVGVAAVTALQALRDHGRLEAGQKVLINGASGGVGTYAVQIAKSMGAEVTGVCSTRNVEMLRSLGADHVIDYKKTSYLEQAEAYDLIVDMVGNHPLLSHKNVLTPNGRFVIVGGEKGNWLGPLKRPIMAALMSPFVEQTYSMMIASMSQGDIEELGDLLASQQLRSVLGEHFALGEVAEAIRISEDGHTRGKMIIRVASQP